MTNLLVTGGAGFIGSSFVGQQVKKGNKVIVLDKLTYAGKKENLTWIGEDKYKLIIGDINDEELVGNIITKYNIDKIIHFAAESHVDNSIKNPDAFIQTNINGTHSLLKAALNQYKKNPNFHFHHISTDEVFGDLPLEGNDRFNEETPYNPSSPYSASKAASDHLVRAYYKTYNLPITISNCSNNYGPRQHGEKLIPTIIRKAIAGEQIGIYGDGKNIRDWIHVDDHNRAVDLILEKGKIGQTYCIGGNNELNNNQVVNKICEILDQIKPKSDKKSYKEQIAYIKDRAGHDQRYAIDGTKIENELGFKNQATFEEGLQKLIEEDAK
ncbi:dTDP-glucose 4,6-dehydratase [Rickettsiales bacterium]|nr:dTDP-glucose 4,6-dehydratase [Rickettsiales bacterium]